MQHGLVPSLRPDVINFQLIALTVGFVHNQTAGIFNDINARDIILVIGNTIPSPDRCQWYMGHPSWHTWLSVYAMI